MPPFDVHAEHSDGSVVVHVVGDLDVATVPELEAELDALLKDGAPRTIVDLTPCTFIDSLSSRAIATCAEWFGDAGLELVVVCPPDNRRVRLVIEIVGLDAVVEVRPSLTPTDDAPT